MRDRVLDSFWISIKENLNKIDIDIDQTESSSDNRILFHPALDGYQKDFPMLHCTDPVCGWRKNPLV